MHPVLQEVEAVCRKAERELPPEDPWRAAVVALATELRESDYLRLRVQLARRRGHA